MTPHLGGWGRRAAGPWEGGVQASAPAPLGSLPAGPHDAPTRVRACVSPLTLRSPGTALLSAELRTGKPQGLQCRRHGKQIPKGAPSTSRPDLAGIRRDLSFSLLRRFLVSRPQKRCGVFGLRRRALGASAAGPPRTSLLLRPVGPRPEPMTCAAIWGQLCPRDAPLEAAPSGGPAAPGSPPRKPAPAPGAGGNRRAPPPRGPEAGPARAPRPSPGRERRGAAAAAAAAM